MSGELMFFLLAGGAGLAALLLRCAMIRKAIAASDVLGVGISAVGVTMAVDVFGWAITHEQTAGTIRVMEMCIGSAATFFVALAEGMKVLSRIFKPSKVKPDAPPPVS